MSRTRVFGSSSGHCSLFRFSETHYTILWLVGCQNITLNIVKSGGWEGRSEGGGGGEEGKGGVRRAERRGIGKRIGMKKQKPVYFLQTFA